MHRIKVKGSDKTYHKRLKWSALDHYIGSAEASTSVGKARVRRDIDVSDHFPVVLRIKTAVRKTVDDSPANKLRFNREKLGEVKQDVVNDRMWSNLVTELESCQLDTRAEVIKFLDGAASKWESTSEKVLVEHNVIGESQASKRKCLPTKVLKLVGIKRVAWAEYLEAEGDGVKDKYEAYKLARKDAAKAVNQVLDDRWLKFVQKGVETFVENDTRKFFKWVDSVTKYKGRNRSTVRPIMDDNGSLVYETDTILNLWAVHFERLFQGGNHEERDFLYWEEELQGSGL
ncbi:hypothetical protein C0995_010170 [Termitomyces sp. Mi166|nr:hypothetical protein C0995_010170 [Termitomyces sp. Mi166\